jgi:hypothetical protein
MRRRELSRTRSFAARQGYRAPKFAAQIREQISRLGLKCVWLHLRFISISIEELVALYRTADIVVYPYRAIATREITTSGALATRLAFGQNHYRKQSAGLRGRLTGRENTLLVDPQDFTALTVLTAA